LVGNKLSEKDLEKIFNDIQKLLEEKIRNGEIDPNDKDAIAKFLNKEFKKRVGEEIAKAEEKKQEQMMEEINQKLADAIKRGEIDPNDKDAIQRFINNE